MPIATVHIISQYTTDIETKCYGEDFQFNPPSSVAGKACILQVKSATATYKNNTYPLIATLSLPQPNSYTYIGAQSTTAWPPHLVGMHEKQSRIVATIDPAYNQEFPRIITQIPAGPSTLSVRWMVMGATDIGTLGSMICGLTFELTPIDEFL